ncbi:MAG TPA: FecR family protein [Nitrospiraceae bacterium]|nr:FecR family protein [Nitrospiraceae bacterium]
MGALATAQVRQIGKAQNAIGALVVIRADGVQERLQGGGSLPLYEGDVLKTDIACRALIEIGDGAQIALNELTTLKLLVRWEKNKAITPILRVSRGEVWVKTTNGSRSIEAETPVANVAARESEFDLKVNEDGQTALTVIEGVAEFGTPFDTCSVVAANATSSVRGKPCKKLPASEGTTTIAWTNPLLANPTLK